MTVGPMGKIGIAFCCIISGVVGAGLVWFLLSQKSYTIFGGSALPAADVDITYGGFIAVLLGIVTIVLGCLAIAVGIVAGLTFENIKKMYDVRLSRMIDTEREILTKQLKREISSEIAKISYGAGAYLAVNAPDTDTDGAEENDIGR